MRTTKLVLGIITLVLCVIVLFQSCAVGIYNTVEKTGDHGGTAGFFVFVFMMVAGIVGISTRNRVYGGYTAAAFYLASSIIAVLNTSVFKDLSVWSALCFIFAAVFYVGSIYMKEDDELSPSPKKGAPPKETCSQVEISGVPQRLYCSKCGNRLEKEDLFCAFCGSPIQKTQKTEEGSVS